MLNQNSFNGKTANGVDIDQTYGMPERKSNRTIFVVANRGIAHILEQKDRVSSPHLLCSIRNEQDRRSRRSTASQNQPTASVPSQTVVGSERSSLANASVEAFCRTILKKLHKVGNGSDGIVLVASPPVLGALRQQLKKLSLRSKPITDFAKDIAGIHSRELSKRLLGLLEA